MAAKLTNMGIAHAHRGKVSVQFFTSSNRAHRSVFDTTVFFFDFWVFIEIRKRKCYANCKLHGFFRVICRHG